MINDLSRGLIIQKKWLDKIFDEGKTWEMRSTNTRVRGPIGLIQSGTGKIMGHADLVHAFEFPLKEINYSKHKIESKDFHLFEKYRYVWVLENVKRFDIPVPYSHPQGAVIWVKI